MLNNVVDVRVVDALFPTRVPHFFGRKATGGKRFPCSPLWDTASLFYIDIIIFTIFRIRNSGFASNTSPHGESLFFEKNALTFFKPWKSWNKVVRLERPLVWPAQYFSCLPHSILRLENILVRQGASVSYLDQHRDHLTLSHTIRPHVWHGKASIERTFIVVWVYEFWWLSINVARPDTNRKKAPLHRYRSYVLNLTSTFALPCLRHRGTA